MHKVQGKNKYVMISKVEREATGSLLLTATTTTLLPQLEVGLKSPLKGSQVTYTTQH